jgi:hypothetical protein
MVPYLFTPGKTPSERRSFGFDFSAAQEFQRSASQPTAQRIASYTVTCDDDALTIETPVLSGNESNPLVVSAYISNGVPATVYSVVFEAVTNHDAIIQRTVLLPVATL